jgi:hypothetical protein
VGGNETKKTKRGKERKKKWEKIWAGKVKNKRPLRIVATSSIKQGRALGAS